MKDYRSMNANRMSAELREMAELAPTPELQECYQRAAALLAPAQGESQPVAWCGWHPKHGYALQTVGHDQQHCASLLMRTDIAGNHGWSCQPLYPGPLTEGDRSCSQALMDVAAERRRQVDVEGWTPDHDDTHNMGEMANAAAVYALTPARRSWTISSHTAESVRERLWPWSEKWWKPKNRRHDLVRAAALIVAEIERLDRKSSPLPSTERGSAA